VHRRDSVLAGQLISPQRRMLSKSSLSPTNFPIHSYRPFLAPLNFDVIGTAKTTALVVRRTEQSVNHVLSMCANLSDTDPRNMSALFIYRRLQYPYPFGCTVIHAIRDLQESRTPKMGENKEKSADNLTWKIVHDASEGGYAVGGFCV
jgi:hypothetical protein